MSFLKIKDGARGKSDGCYTFRRSGAASAALLAVVALVFFAVSLTLQASLMAKPITSVIARGILVVRPVVESHVSLAKRTKKIGRVRKEGEKKENLMPSCALYIADDDNCKTDHTELLGCSKLVWVTVLIWAHEKFDI